MLNRLYSYFFNKSNIIRDSFSKAEGQSPWRTKISSIFHIFVLEIFTAFFKFLVLLAKSPYDSFQLFTNQYTLPICQYSYFDHKKFQKKVRLFSLAGLSSLISATIIINIILSLIIPGQLPSYAKTVNGPWDDWSLTNLAGDPPSGSSGSLTISPSNTSEISGTGTDSLLQLKSTSYTATDDGTFATTGSADGGGFFNGTHSNTAVSGTTDSITYAQATGTAGWAVRRGSGVVVYNNKMWIFGGSDNTTYYNDVWYSTNGADWTLATAGAGWSARRGHGAVVYNNKMWIFGGRNASARLNDVWYSTDGITWTQATGTAGWAVRSGIVSAVYNNKMWVIGGSDGTNRKNDVWYSTNGADWTQATGTAGWSQRDSLSGGVYNNKMWVMGGYDGTTYKNDVWYSTDGITWTQVTGTANWSARGDHSLVVYNNKMWVMGGLEGGTTYKNDIWYSADGISWIESTSSANWAVRKTFSTVIYNNKIWVMGGQQDSTTNKNDVWYSADGSSGAKVSLASASVTDWSTRRTGISDTPGSASGVAVSGNYAYVADGTAGLQPIDISNPASPIQGTPFNTSGIANRVAISGNYAYVADGSAGLQIINISDPMNPTSAGTPFNTDGTAFGVAISGNYAYVADQAYGLQVINISNPASPTFAGNYDTPGTAFGVAISGNYAYVADYNVGGLQIIDISNPASPSYVGWYDTASYANEVAISGNYAYVADYSTVQVINISNPASPTLAGFYDNSVSARGVAVSGNYAYVADDTSGLHIVNISDPAAPSTVGIYDIPGATGNTEALRVAVSGNYAYVATQAYGLQIINISNPIPPALAGNYSTSGFASGIIVSGNYAYIADYIGLQTIDIFNPTSPVPGTPYNTTGDPLGVAVSGNYAYVADGWSTDLKIINISDPMNPTSAGTPYNTPGTARGVAVSGNYAYVADDTSGLHIVDISNPAAPISAGTPYDTPGIARGVAVSGNYAYVADDTFGLQIVDISNPAAPSLTGTYDTLGTAYSVAVSGNYAYVADYNYGLQVIDISTPAAPTLAGTYDSPGTGSNAYGISLSGNYAYIANASKGLTIINISNPVAPIIAGYYDTSGTAWGVAVSGNYAYMADGTAGLKVISLAFFLAPGTFTSASINLGGPASYGTVSVNAALDGSITIITLKARSDADGDFGNAPAWSSCSNIASGGSLTGGACVTNGHQYIQYQAALSTTDSAQTPYLNSITFNYSQYPTTSTVSNLKFNTTYTTVSFTNISWVRQDSYTASTIIKPKLQTRVADSEANLASATFVGYDNTNTNSSTYFDKANPNCSEADGKFGDTSGAHATKKTVTCSINGNNTTINSSANQWLELQITLLSDGGSTPQIDAARAQYSVNANPEVCYTTTDTTTCNTSISLTASQSSSSSNYGHIVFNSYARDSDTDTGTVSPGQVLVGLEYSDTSGNFSQASPPTGSTSYYNSGNFASNFTLTPITSGITCSSTGFTTAWKYLCSVKTGANANDFSQYTIDWNAKQDLNSRYTAAQKIRFLANDQEGINSVNTSTPGTSSNFTYDTVNPTVTTLTVNATGLATSNNQNVTLACSDDTTAFNSQYALSDNGTTWDAYNNIICNSSTTSILRTMTENASRATPLYYKFRDYYGNETTSASVTTGQKPTALVIQDVSNVVAVPPTYQNFLSWEVVSIPVNGWDSYKVYRCVPPAEDLTCAQATNYTQVSTISNRAVNYYNDTDVTSSATYYYRIVTKDSSNHLSNWSTSVYGIANGTQDGGEGGGGGDSTPPIISSISIPSADITQTSARVIWTTNESANAGVFYSVNTAYGSEKSSLSYLTSGYDASTNPAGRYIDTTGLSPGTIYNIQLKSTDASGNQTICDATSSQSTVTSATNKTTATNNSSYCPSFTTYTFTTATTDTTAPVISNITSSVTSSSASVSWTTNESSDTCISSRDAATNTYATEQCKTESVTSHSLTLGNLSSSTTYYIKVKSRDASSNVSNNCYANTDNASITNSDCPAITSINSLSFTTNAPVAAAGSGGGGGGKADYDAPRMSDISISDIKINSAIVTWNTNENSSSFVEYGEDQSALKNTDGQVDSVSNHKVLAKDLKPNTKYYFKVLSIDWAGNIGSSDLQSFTTKKEIVSKEELIGSEQTKQETQKVLEDLKEQIKVQGDTLNDPLQALLESFSSLVPEPIIVGGAPEVKIETTFATVSWLTDKNSNSFVALVRDDQYDAKAGDPYNTVVGNPDDFMKEHTVEIQNLLPGTKYHFQVRSKALLGETSKSKDFTLITKSELPQILNYLQKKTDNEKTATVYWETTVPTDSVVKYTPYGKDGKLKTKDAKIEGKSDMVSDHNITISGFDPGTVYQMEISGKDPFGNQTSKVLPDFTTAIDKEPPVISQVRIESAMISGKTPKIQTIISWRTDEPSTGQTFFTQGTGQTEKMKSTALDTAFSTIHTAVVTEFKPASIYRIRIESKDDSGNLAVSRDFTILTPVKSESIIDVIVKTFENTFGWVKNIKF